MLDSLRAMAMDLAFADGQVKTLAGGQAVLPRPGDVTGHRLHDRFLAELAEDPVLERLFSQGPENLQVPTHFVPDQGLPAYLINAAAWHAKRVGDLSEGSFVERLEEALGGLREAISTGRAVGTAFVAYTLKLPAGCSVETPWGRLRPREDRDQLIIAEMAMGEPPPAGVSVLEAPVEYRWSNGKDGSRAFHTPGNPDEDRWRCLSLAVLLTLGPLNPYPAVPWLITAYAPFLDGTPGGAMMGELMLSPEVSEDQLPELQRWCESIGRVSPPEIALHRTFSMMQRRGDPVDSFVDAVIVWESLFGTGGTQELTYRVSLNMACAITSDTARRVELQREIQRLYGTRSRIVHGELRVDHAEAQRLRGRSRELTVMAWTGLIGEHPYLVRAKAPQFVAFVLGGKQGAA